MSAASRQGDSTRTVLGAWDDSAGPELWGQALPASVWHQVLGTGEVTLEITAADRAAVTVWGAREGRRRKLSSLTVTEEGAVLILPLRGDDQEWYWVEGPARSVVWSTGTALALPPVTVVMPTRRREQDALTQAARFAEMDVVHRVLIIDQGDTLAALPETDRMLAAHPSISLMTQPNLGGSGGYARGMLEASSDPAAAVLLSDDDAVLSEETLRRMVTYQALAARPTILGTPLFSSTRPTQLQVHSEQVGPRAFQWRPADGMHGAVDLAGTSPTDWSFTTTHSRTNYTGWWGTLLPPGTVAALGLPAPLFLKWDDAEYGLRATAHGYDHAVLPGTAVHHPPWTAFRTQMSWTARVLHRNRLAISAAYGAGRGVIASSLVHQLKHILSGHLLTAELWEDAVDAMRAGPGTWMGHDLQRAREDGEQIAASWHALHDLPLTTTPTHREPLPLLSAGVRALRQMLPGARPDRVLLAVPAEDVRWRTTLGADAVLVLAEDGSTEAAFEVRGADMRRMLRRSLRSHLGLALHWGSLRRRYGAALPTVTTAESWTAVFSAASVDDPAERI